MIFAESIASNVNWTLIATIVMALATLGMWWDAKKNKATVIEPNPLPVQKIWPSATILELKEAIGRTDSRLDKHEGQIAEIREIIRRELPEMERRISMAGEQRVEKIHNRINEVLSEVSKLEGLIARDHGV